MLPVTLQFLIAMIAYAINERMARRLDYVQEEVRVLTSTTLRRNLNSPRAAKPWAGCLPVS